MTSIQKPVLRARTLTAATGLALALALTGCGGTQTDSEPKKTDEAAQTEESGDSNGMQGQAAPTESENAPAANPSEPAADPSETKSEDPYADAARATSWASDDSMKVDKEGDGKIPAASLEADLIDLFENKFDIKTEKAECAHDMEVVKWYGFETCNVVTKKKTYYGTVKLIEHKDNMIKYELVFPGLDKGDVDFSD